MGGQTLQNESIMLDMMTLDKVYYNPDSKTVKVEAGATWKKVLEVLNQYNRSIKVMQADTIFTVGRLYRR